MNPKKLKVGDRIIWDELDEEIVIENDPDRTESFTTIDLNGALSYHSSRGKITNARKMKRSEYTISINDLMQDLKCNFIQSTFNFSKTMLVLKELE